MSGSALSSDNRDQGLVRVVGVWPFAASIVNGVVGAGIFSLPSSMARLAGAWAPAAFVICAVALGAVVYCAAAASRRVATSGGCYGYADAAFGPVTAFVTGMLVWVSAVLACGGIAAALADGLAASLPILGQPIARSLFIVAVIAFMGWINLRGVDPAARFVGILTLLKLVPLLLLVIVGGVALALGDAAPPTHAPPTAFGQAVILALFAFSGMETPLSASGEVAQPDKTIPRALFLSTAFVTLLYIAIQLVTSGLLGDALAGSATPLADAMGRVAPVLGLVLLLGASLSRFAWIGSDIFGAPRVLFAFARDGMLPGWLASVHPRTHAPHVAIVLHSVIAILLAISGSFEPLAILAGLASAGIYLIVCAAAWRIEWQAGSRNAPALVVAALVGMASMVLIIALGTPSDIGGLVLLVLVSLLWALFKRSRPAPGAP